MKLSSMASLIFLSLVTSVFTFQKFEPGDSVKKNQVYHTMASYDEVLRNDEFSGFGYFWFDEFCSMSLDSVPSAVSIFGGLGDTTKQDRQQIDAEVRIGGIQLVRSDDLQRYEYHFDDITPLNNLYGNKIQFQVNVLTDPVFSVSDSLYVPKIIKLNFPGYVSLMTDRNKIIEATDLSAGQMIYWNADRLNQIGVCLLIEYSSTVPGNGKLNKRPDKKPVMNWVLLEDIGSYRLEPGLFEGIPNKAAIKLTITRGNYLILKNQSQPGKDIKLSGCSRLQGLFRYKNR